MSDPINEDFIESILCISRNITKNDFMKFCDQIVHSLTCGDRSTEILNLLRQLYCHLLMIDNANIFPLYLTDTLHKIHSTSENEALKYKFLFVTLLKEISPSNYFTNIKLSHFNDSRTLFARLSLLLSQTNNICDFSYNTSLIAKWITELNFIEPEYLLPSLSYLAALTDYCSPQYLAKDTLNLLNVQIGKWLRFAPKTQSSFGNSRLPRKQSPKNLVKEPDGVNSQDFFTCLNLSLFYNLEQVLSILTWSILRRWIHNCYYSWDSIEILSNFLSKTSLSGRNSPQRKLISDTTNNHDNFLSVRQTEIQIFGGLKENSISYSDKSYSKFYSSAGNCLQNRVLEYCQRLLEQTHRRPQRDEDIQLIKSILIEVVLFFKDICAKDTSLVAFLAPELKNITYRYECKNLDDERLLLQLISFFLYHGDAISDDSQKNVNMFLGSTLLTSYESKGLVLDTILFATQNLSFLRGYSFFFVKYFPNWFKIIAWHPVTYIDEFQKVVSFMLDKYTSLELFHIILDLPCLSAALQAQCYYKVGRSLRVFHKSINACRDPQYQFVFKFLLRTKSGQCDTIDKLNILISVLSDMSVHPRVIASCNVASLLLKKYFAIILLNRDKDLFSKLIPIILERSTLLYPNQNFVSVVRYEMKRCFIHIFCVFPWLLMDHFNELLEFLHSLTNLSNSSEDFFSCIVFTISKTLDSNIDSRCTIEIYEKFYEIFESVTYEISARFDTSNRKSFIDTSSIKLLSILLTAMAKLASRNQILIPRVILCINKVSSQIYTNYCTLSYFDYHTLYSRSQQLIFILKFTNITSIVYNSIIRLYLPSNTINLMKKSQIYYTANNGLLRTLPH